MENTPTSLEINNLFANGNPEEVWPKATGIVRRISPAYDFSVARSAFDDVVRLFRGEYPGYCPIRTLYHDLHHTLDVFLCAVRLMHGVHLSDTRLSDDEMTLIMVAALMHDIGYAQREGEESGTGAQYTQSHVSRGIEFMQRYVADRHLPPELATRLKFIILCTDPALVISRIHFPDDRTRLLGQIVSTADLTGQMADRTYLEKLLFLYLEFEEAHFGSFQNIHDLLRKTRNFYVVTRQKLDGELGGIHAKLAFHFKDRFGVENNYYLESIEKNIAYLDKVTALNEAKYLSMLKRGGIVEKTEALIAQG
ncbi:MAG: HD domain-containing protein [Nitrosomonadales bacterium]|nr:HD domain-containing protein [Nitrosomonadales bacterium]